MPVILIAPEIPPDVRAQRELRSQAIADRMDRQWRDIVLQQERAERAAIVEHQQREEAFMSDMVGRLQAKLMTHDPKSRGG